MLLLTEIYIFLVLHVYRLSFGNLVVNLVHFLLTENIKRGNHLIQNINVDRFFCRISTILMQRLKI